MDNLWNKEIGIKYLKYDSHSANNMKEQALPHRRSDNQPPHRRRDRNPSPFQISVPQLQVIFNLPLPAQRIRSWRGAVAMSAGWEHSEFHNHATNSQAKDPYQRRYPNIHYRSERGKAAIWAIGTGVLAVQQWMQRDLSEFAIGGKIRSLQPIRLVFQPAQLALTNHWHTYHLRHYIPLRPEHLRQWEQQPQLSQRAGLLERLLVGHLLGFCTAVDWQLPARLEVELFHYEKPHVLTVHRQKRLGFNLDFRCNLQLPAGMALGRSVAFGFGVVKKDNFY